MLSLPLLVVAAVAIPTGIGIQHARRAARRRRLMSTPLPEDWRLILEREVDLYRLLPDRHKPELSGHLHNFLGEKHFEGCGGLTLTEEMKIIIAAQACLLLLGREITYFPKCDAILVYPGAYIAPQTRPMGNTVVQEQSVRLGESWTRGVVVLAWDHVQEQARDAHCGHNVVLHEFAHQLDQEDGAGDGTPVLRDRAQYVAWARVMGRTFTELTQKTMHGQRDVLDAYGATNPAEFFAVSTEAFFTKPAALAQERPGLYRMLHEYYRLDPIAWSQ